MQGAGKPMNGLGGAAFIMTSCPSLAVKEVPAARLLAWAITNTSNLAQAVHKAPCLSMLLCLFCTNLSM